MEQKKKVLQVKDLRISFKTDNGKVQAVRGVSFDLYKGETLCIVGESGSGKSVTSKAIIGILSNNAIVEGGQIIYEGEDLLRISEAEFHKIRGHKIGMIFQDPLSSLNPIVRIGKQITETMLINANLLKKKYEDLIGPELTAYKNAKVIRNASNISARAEYDYECEQLDKELKTLSDELSAKKDEYAQTADSFLKQEIDSLTVKLSAIAADVKSRKANYTADLKNKRKDADKKYTSSLPMLKKALKERKKSAKKEVRQYKDSLKAKRNDKVAVSKTGLHDAKAMKKSFFEWFDSYLKGGSARKQERKAIKSETAGRRNFVNQYLIYHKNSVKHIMAVEAKIDSLRSAYADDPDRMRKEAMSFVNELEEAKKNNRYFFAWLRGYIAKWLKAVTSPNGKLGIFAQFSEYCRENRKIVSPFLSKIKEDREEYINSIKVTRKYAKARALEVMREVGIPQPEKRYMQYPFQFSGGMRQRIVIAIALTAAPDVLICDEPTTALDVTIQAQILELINNLKAERQLSVIFITHDLGVVANMADRVAVMYAGKICEYGTDKEIFFDPRHPYTWALLASIPDIDSKEKLEAIPGTPPDMIYPPVGDAFAQRNKYAIAIDFKYQPPFFKVTDTHYAATWLLYPDAPKVSMPKIVSTRIKKALEEEAKYDR